MIKDIVVSLSTGRMREGVTDYAASVAAEFGAHILGLGFAFEPTIPGSVVDSAAAGFIAAYIEENKKKAHAAAAKFEETARRRNCRSVESKVALASYALAAGQFARIARRFDLSIVTQAEPDWAEAEDLIIEAALFESGRPVLVVPYIQDRPLKLDRVMICWDGSRAAARAVADAMPFLTRAKAVDVVIVEGELRKSDEMPGADIAHHLARHGLNVDLRTIAAGDVDVPNTILSDVADTGADLLVMGGYGHSRWRELILGGVTRTILTSMTVPTLMSH